jgi:4-hydroxybenzoyl-CoA thioesterase
MSWHRAIDVEFNHCDPAGIVFYPRYFEMTNAAVESLFRDGLRHPFARLMAEGAGVPTARIEIDFRAPSRLGDRLDLAVDVVALGRSSVTFAHRGHGGRRGSAVRGPLHAGPGSARAGGLTPGPRICAQVCPRICWRRRHDRHPA